MLSPLKRILPHSVKAILKNVINEGKDVIIGPSYAGDRFICPICETKLAYFAPLPWSLFKSWDVHQYIHSIFQLETLNILHYCCPKCGASDRQRLFYFYLNQRFATLEISKKYRFIDFAPARGLSGWLKSHPVLEYRSADLYRQDVDDNVDIMDMAIYEDNSIDMFLCSHVLEHVENDRKAMGVLYRILRPGGWGITMVPVQLNLENVYENPSITSEAERWTHFGQGDHVRLYSKQGFVDRLENVGFQVNQYGIDYFGRYVFEKHGIHPRSVLYVVEKPAHVGDISQKM